MPGIGIGVGLCVLFCLSTGCESLAARDDNNMTERVAYLENFVDAMETVQGQYYCNSPVNEWLYNGTWTFDPTTETYTWEISDGDSSPDPDQP